MSVLFLNIYSQLDSVKRCLIRNLLRLGLVMPLHMFSCDSANIRASAAAASSSACVRYMNGSEDVQQVRVSRKTLGAKSSMMTPTAGKFGDKGSSLPASWTPLESDPFAATPGTPVHVSGVSYRQGEPSGGCHTLMIKV